MLEYIDDFTYKKIGDLPHRPVYCRSVWQNSGYYTLQRDGSILHAYAYGQQQRKHTFDAPVVALWGSVIKVYALTLRGQQYSISTHSAPQPIEPWDAHYFLEYLKKIER